MAEKKRPSSSASRSKPSGSSQGGKLAAALIFLVVLCLGVIYLQSGLDPLGVFTTTAVAPVDGEVAATLPAPTQTSLQTPPAGAAGRWWQVYFTDPATINDSRVLQGSLAEKLIQYIDRAQTSIHIASFEFNLTPVAEALIAAKKRGVDVLWITDDEFGLEVDSEVEHGQFAMLKKAKIKVIDDGRVALMHDKFWIFDGKTVWTGSTNITDNDIFRNNNNVIIFDSPEIAAIYEREFAEMWDGNFGPKSPSTIADQSVTIDRTPVQILFSPEDNVISHLVPLVQKARKSIYFMAFSFTNNKLTDAMLERAQAGLTVTGIFERRASETEYSALPPMFCAGLPVRQDGNPGTFHHKVIIIDNKIVVTGSLNFSDNADESNSENTIVITNTDIAKLYLAEFQRRWDEAQKPDRADMGCK